MGRGKEVTVHRSGHPSHWTLRPPPRWPSVRLWPYTNPLPHNTHANCSISEADGTWISVDKKKYWIFEMSATHTLYRIYQVNGSHWNEPLIPSVGRQTHRRWWRSAGSTRRAFFQSEKLKTVDGVLEVMFYLKQRCSVTVIDDIKTRPFTLKREKNNNFHVFTSQFLKKKINRLQNWQTEIYKIFQVVSYLEYYPLQSGKIFQLCLRCFLKIRMEAAVWSSRVLPGNIWTVGRLRFSSAYW